MTVILECKADEALAKAVGVPRQSVQHFLGRGRVCNRLAHVTRTTGMMDEDPEVTKPLYFSCLVYLSGDHAIQFFLDKERDNRVLVLRPRLEEWLVQTAKDSSCKMTDYGFASDNGVRLHGEINQRLDSLRKLAQDLLKAESKRMLRLRELLNQS